MVAQKFGTDHEEFIVEPNAVEILPTLAWHYDQPFADSSALPTYYVSRMTRQHVTVALNGDGGDEWFGGYERYRALLVRGLYQAATTPALRDIASQVARFDPGPVAGRQPRQAASSSPMPRAARSTSSTCGCSTTASSKPPSAPRLYSPDFAARLGPANADRYFLDLMIDSANRRRRRSGRPRAAHRHADVSAGHAARESRRRVDGRGARRALAAARHVDHGVCGVAPARLEGHRAPEQEDPEGRPPRHPAATRFSIGARWASASR